MKQRIPLSAHPFVFYTTVFFASVILLGACSRKIHFNSSPVVPAAEGNIKVKKDKNNNYSVSINVVNLAEPGKLTPAKNKYVVWMETKSNGTKNIGQLSISSGLFSKTLKGSLVTVSPFQPVKIFITAEDEGDIQHPGYQVVLMTDSF